MLEKESRREKAAAFLTNLSPKRKGELILAFACERLFEQWRLMMAFVLTSKARPPESGEEVKQLSRAFVHGMLSRAGSDKSMAQVFRTLGTWKVRDLQASASAATLVFSHSVLDAFALDLCWLTRLANPSYWESLISKKKVELAEVRAKKYQSLVQEELVRLFKELERASMLKIFNHQSPSPTVPAKEMVAYQRL